MIDTLNLMKLSVTQYKRFRSIISSSLFDSKLRIVLDRQIISKTHFLLQAKTFLKTAMIISLTTALLTGDHPEILKIGTWKRIMELLKNASER